MSPSLRGWVVSSAVLSTHAYLEDLTTTAHPKLTTESSAPVPDDQHSQSAGPGGPLLFQDMHLLEKLARFNRGRIPERVVHARGSGAYRHFEVTHDVTPFTRARFLGEIGKRSEVFARFSTVAGGRGAADAVRDPLKFPDFIQSQKPDPRTNRQEPDNVWDFFSLSPEATHVFTWLFGDRGIPASYRHMDGFGSHTFQWVNAAGERVWVKYHFKTDQGIKCLTAEEAALVAGEAPDSHQIDLLEAIDRGEHPSWTLKVQIMTEDEARAYRFNPFDVTKVWP